MVKRLLRSQTVQAILGRFIALYMRLIRATTRWHVEGIEHIEPVWREGGGVVACLWHSRLMMGFSSWPRDAQRVGILISRSSDGEFVAKAAERLNFAVMRGSTRNPKKDKGKGGTVAFREMLDFVTNGGCMCVMPDGPRGPRMRARGGAVKLAHATQSPLFALGLTTKWRIVFKSWDRFVLPLPFGRGVIVWSQPIAPPEPGASDEALEAMRQDLEDRLNAATTRADEAVGGAVIQPAPVDPRVFLANPVASGPHADP